MQNTDPFQLQDFMPYLLNLAAETTSLEFQKFYRARYDMLRTEWRVVFHLGRYGSLTAKSICTRSRLHKTKVSRAVAALEKKRFLARETVEGDRRQELLSLTKSGRAAFNDLVVEAQGYNEKLMAPFTVEEYATVRRFLLHMAKIDQS